MDFNYKLARINTELFKRDLSKGLRVTDLQVIGSGSTQKVFSYKNLVIKELLEEWANTRDEKAIEQKYNKLLVKLSGKGIAQNLKFAPFLDFAKKHNKFYTISPFIDGTELPDCTAEQLSELGIDGIKKYIENNQKLSMIRLSPEFHDARNFKLSSQGNINVIDYNTTSFPSLIHRGSSISCYGNMKRIMESINLNSFSIITKSSKDKRVMDNLRVALEQTPNSSEALQRTNYLLNK